MDKLRGLAVLLVLIYHAADLTAAAGISVSPIIEGVNEFLRPFRIPMLMLLSGLLLPKALTKKPSTYSLGKIRSLAWPYIIWAGLFLLAIGEAADHSGPAAWIAAGHMWYVFFLLVFYFVAPFLRFVPYWVTAAVAFTASVAVTTFNVLDVGTLLEMFAYFAVYFFAGAAVASASSAGKELPIPTWAIIVSSIMATALGVHSIYAGASIAFHSIYTPLSLAGIVALVGIAQRIPNRRTWLSRVGENSMAFYAAHYPAMILVSAWMPASADGGHFLALLTAGLGVSIALHAATTRGHLRWLFVMPWKTQGNQPIDAVTQPPHQPPPTQIR